MNDCLDIYVEDGGSQKTTRITCTEMRFCNLFIEQPWYIMLYQESKMPTTASVPAAFSR